MKNNYFKNLNLLENIKFGNYWQGINEEEGKTPIEWIVVSKKDNEFLLVSLYCLDCKKFNEKKMNAIWKDSDIRKWLNNYFFDQAFSNEEKDIIVEKSIINKNVNLEEDANGNTLDKIFLLSVDEIKEYFESNESRMTAPTKFAVFHNAYQNLNYKTKEGTGTCFWWSRSAGNHFSNIHVAGVNYFGYIGISGNLPTANNFAIRPAIWIKVK